MSNVQAVIEGDEEDWRFGNIRFSMNWREALTTGSYVALGQKIDLSRLRLPMYLLAGSAPTKWLPRNNCSQWSGWYERSRSISAARSPRAII
jgi:hypothetical protein